MTMVTSPGVATINIRGKERLCRIEQVDLDKLLFDIENIRLKHITTSTKMSQKALGDYLYGKIEGTAQLKKGISANGGIVEPLLVQVVDGKYLVREGNRRLACLRKLKEEAHEEGVEDFPPTQFDKTSCAILPNDITEEDMAVYLGQVHVVGKKEWKTFNKAWLVYWMDGGNANMTHQVIAKTLGMSKASVQRMIQAYKYTERYGRTTGDKDWLTRYSHFEELYKGRSKLPKEYLTQVGQTEIISDEFLDWFGGLFKQNRIGRGENVRLLLKMYANNDKDAIKLVEKGGIGKAWALHEEEHPELTSPIYKAIDQATTALDKISLNEFDVIRHDDGRIDKLKKLRSKVDRILIYATAVHTKGVQPTD